jgi:L-fuculose-phosphate aldolase
VGETVGKAYSLTEILEEMAEIYYRTRVAGDPIILGPDQISETRAKIATYGQTKPSAGQNM